MNMTLLRSQRGVIDPYAILPFDFLVLLPVLHISVKKFAENYLLTLAPPATHRFSMDSSRKMI